MRPVRLLGTLHIFQFSSQVGMGGEVLSQSNKRADDEDVQLNGAIAGQNGRKHRYSVLGESVGRKTSAATPNV
jgi:hypothetical protein